MIDDIKEKDELITALLKLLEKTLEKK